MLGDSDLLLTRHRTIISIVRELLDPSLVVGLLLGLVLLHGEPPETKHLLLGLLSAFVVLWAFRAAGLYRSFRSAGVWAELPRLILGWAYTVSILLFVGFLTGATELYPFPLLLRWFLAVPLVLGAAHVVLRAVLQVLRARGLDSRTAVVAGTGPLARALIERIQGSPWWGIRLLGAFDDAPEGMPCVRLLGDLATLPGFVKRERVSLVYLALPSRATNRATGLISALGDTTASVYYVPDIFLTGLTSVTVQDAGGLPALVVCETPFANAYYRLLKRLSDIVLSSLLLLLAAVPMAIIAVAVRRSSPGPVIFRQRRYGLNGQEIVVYKFRTMRVTEDGDGVETARRGDPRVTPVGAFLRRTSLDELPQLFNVLQGRMSLVGPRPLAIAQNETYRALIEGYMVRHKVKPGITGWAQINGLRGGDALDKVRRRVEYDLHYVRNWSPWLDMKIIVRTAFVMLHDENAY